MHGKVRLSIALNNTTTLAAECAKDGRDYMSVLRQRSKELNLMRKLNIPLNGDDSPDEIKPEPDDGSEPKEAEINE